MYKSFFFRFINRINRWIHDRRQELYFLIMLIFILLALGFGIFKTLYYREYPMFPKPHTILEHIADSPIIIGIFSTAIVLLFGLFFTHFLVMIPFKKLSFLKIEMEFASHIQKEKQIENQFLYTSTMLNNHIENVKYLNANQLFDLKQILLFLAKSYERYSLSYNENMPLEVDIHSVEEVEGKREKKLLRHLQSQKQKEYHTVYSNRLTKGDNLLLGVLTAEDTNEEIVLSLRRGYDHPFDTYDQETWESILAYAIILYDVTVMVNLLASQESSLNHESRS